MRAHTEISLEDGRRIGVEMWSDPARHDLWFLDAKPIAREGDVLEVGPFVSEVEVRVHLFSRVERELGRIAAVTRYPS